jgi:hypothetical protein
MDDEDIDAPLHEVLDDNLRVRYFKGYRASVAQAIKWVANYYYVIDLSVLIDVFSYFCGVLEIDA